MSFLNPPAAKPKLGVDLTPLVALRNLRSISRTLDVQHFAQAAEEAGADVIRLTVESTASKQIRDDIDGAMRTATEVHVAMPLTREMIDFAGMVRPHSVCFTACDVECNGEHDGERKTALSTKSLQSIMEALACLQQQSVHVVLSLDPATSQLQAVADAGIRTIEFNTNTIAQSDPVDLERHHSILRDAVLYARRLGMTVQLAHGIDYGNVHRIAASGDIDQINVGYAVAARAIVVGWQSAVREMKALLVTASTSSSYRANEDAGG